MRIENLGLGRVGKLTLECFELPARLVQRGVQLAALVHRRATGFGDVDGLPAELDHAPDIGPGEADTPSSSLSEVAKTGAGAATGAAGASPGCSPQPSASRAEIRRTASPASGPTALTTMASPWRVAKAMIATTDLALASSAPRTRRTSALKRLAAAAGVAAD